jgi:hypothetical protein
MQSGVIRILDQPSDRSGRKESQIMPHGKVLVAQGGGPTAVINQSMAGVVLEARKFRNVELVYGAYHGVPASSTRNSST